MRRTEHFPHRLHQRVPHDDGQIRTRVTLGLIREGAVIRLRELTRRRADVEVEHFDARGRVGQGDVDAFFESVRSQAGQFEQRWSSADLGDSCTSRQSKKPHRYAPSLDGDIERPRDVGRAEDEHARLVVPDSVHLDEELGLDPPRRFRLAFASCTAERVDFVDKDDRWGVLSCHRKELLDEPVRGSLRREHPPTACTPKSGVREETACSRNAPFTLSHPLADQIGRTDAEKGTLGFGRDRLGEVTLTGSGRSVQEDAAPRGSFAGEEVRELDREDDGFLEGFFRLFETGDVFPPDVGRFGQDGAWWDVWCGVSSRGDEGQKRRSHSLDKPSRSFLFSASSSSPCPFLACAPPPPPLTAFLLPSASAFAFASSDARWSLSFSARSRYSSTLDRIRSFSFGFFSSAGVRS
jgi:hypothetical protein